MRCKFLAIQLMVFSVSGYSSANSVEKNSPIINNKTAVRAFDDRSTNVKIINWLVSPKSDMILVDYGLESGEWKKLPPSRIPFNSPGTMATTSNTWLHGAGGFAKYRVENDGAVLTFSWYNPYSASNSYQLSAEPDDYYFNKKGGSGNNASIELTVKRKSLPIITNYSAIIMADPQPWRLDSGGDPNSNRQNGSQWRQINQKTFKSILTHPDIRFHIINGDLTEFGRSSQYNDYANIYHSSNVVVAEGLGNHDYANNVGDCVDFLLWGFSKDGCALSAIDREYRSIQSFKEEIAKIPATAFRADIAEKAMAGEDEVATDYMGSFAYSWDAGDVHYVQLHNYPTYTANLSADGFSKRSVKISKSLDWLAEDLDKADRRGKISIINFHDARPAANDGDSHFLNGNNLTELARFKSIITSHAVKAIFAGHTHQQAYCRAKNDTVFGNIPIYTSGALFKGDYYLINVRGKEIKVTAYNGKTGFPVLVKELGVIGSDSNFSDSCSRL